MGYAKSLPLFLLEGMLLSILAASTAEASPLVNMTIVGRIKGTAAPFASSVTITSTTQQVEFKIYVDLADVGTQAHIGWPARDGEVVRYIASLKAPDGTQTLYTPPFDTTLGYQPDPYYIPRYYDGIKTVNFDVYQALTDANQVTIMPWALDSGWTTGPKATVGVHAMRGRVNGQTVFDLANVVADRLNTMACMVSDGVHEKSLLGTGTAYVRTLVPGQTSSLTVGANFPIRTVYDPMIPVITDPATSVTMAINGDPSFSLLTDNPEPLVGISSLALIAPPLPPSRVPEPATLALVGFGLAAIAMRRRRRG
jgi:hypothetical protein